jgi:hypothetical protein
MRGASPREGRPKKPAKPGTRTQIGIRVGADIKRLLDDAMSRSGRTQSQEAELRLEISFRSEQLPEHVLELGYGAPFTGLVLMLARAMDRAGRIGVLSATERSFERIDDWLTDPYAYDQAVQAAELIFKALRPDGDPRFPGRLPGHAGLSSHDYLGADLAVGALAAVKDPDDVNADMPQEAQNIERENFGRRINRLIGKKLVEQIKVPSLRDARDAATAQGASHAANNVRR